jgi:16S rRNA (cytosine1407-C5)-methyltransferase
MKHTFKDYFIENFFPGDEEEFARFSRALLARRPKTFRINRLKTDAASFAKRWKARGLPMDPTMNPSVFSVGDERVKLGNEPEHLGGQIYVQDLSASMSVEILSGGEADERADLLVLDMAASPGGKTTQLAEMYPNALIVANEIDKTRMPQLLENIERMGSDNVAVTNYSGAFFAGAGEIFDRILLDAPCSGEGIAHKAPESLEYWNLKNVKKIAGIQTRLLSAALDTLAVGGVMVYSTCTLNKLENE